MHERLSTASLQDDEHDGIDGTVMCYVEMKQEIYLTGAAEQPCRHCRKALTKVKINQNVNERSFLNVQVNVVYQINFEDHILIRMIIMKELWVFPLKDNLKLVFCLYCCIKS